MASPDRPNRQLEKLSAERLTKSSSRIGRLYRGLVVAAVCFGVGAVLSLVVFFALVFAFAGQNASTWVHWYFGNNGWPFLASVAIIALIVFPKVKHLKLV